MNAVSETFKSPTHQDICRPPATVNSTQLETAPTATVGVRYIYTCVAAAGGVGFTTKLGVHIHRVLDSRSSCYMARSSREG